MIGQKLVADAHESLHGEGIFSTMRKKKAQELMKSHWEENITKKQGMEKARKVFVW